MSQDHRGAGHSLLAEPQEIHQRPAITLPQTRTQRVIGPQRTGPVQKGQASIRSSFGIRFHGVIKTNPVCLFLPDLQVRKWPKPANYPDSGWRGLRIRLPTHWAWRRKKTMNLEVQLTFGPRVMANK